MKVLIFIDQMGSGGAARVTSSQCFALRDLGYDITLAFDNVNHGIIYPIPQEVKIETFYSPTASKGGLSTIRYRLNLIHSSRRIIRKIKPDVIIAVQSNIFMEVFFAKLFSGIPIVVSDHTAIDRKIDIRTDFIRNRLYGLADKIVLLTKKDVEYLGKKFRNKTFVYNPLTYSILQDNKPRRKNVLCVGRVDAWSVKGFDRIINMWGKISSQYPDWVLEIAGNGSPQGFDKLNRMIADNNVANSVRLLGHVNDMKSLYQESSIFALPSRVEGFPMVLQEAMSQKCACISFAFKGSTREMCGNYDACVIIEDNNLDEFQNKLQSLIDSEPDRTKLGNSAAIAVSGFSLKHYGEEWNTIIKSLTKQ